MSRKQRLSRLHPQKSVTLADELVDLANQAEVLLRQTSGVVRREDERHPTVDVPYLRVVVRPLREKPDRVHEHQRFDERSALDRAPNRLAVKRPTQGAGLFHVRGRPSDGAGSCERPECREDSVKVTQRLIVCVCPLAPSIHEIALPRVLASSA